MENKYLAKSDKIKTIKEHTQDLLNQYKILKKIFPDIMNKEEWEILEYAIKYHDIGKINTKFQNKLYKKLGMDLLEDKIEGEEVPHNFLSPLFIDTDNFEEQYGRELTKILVSAVYYHHVREEKEINQEILKDLEQQKKGLEGFFNLKLDKINNSIRRYILRVKDEEILKSKSYIMIKGLLNKIDYVSSLDKAGVNIEEEVRENGQTVCDKIKVITQEKYMNNYREVQRYMLSRQKKNLIVESYTGSGKTEAALLWIDDSKAFYTLPLKVSINAMYKRITEVIEYKKALLLHSDAYEYYENKEDSLINSYDRARRLSSPLIVTTVDQLFKIAFRYKGYEEILATLSYSKVVLDEIQMYSPEMIAYIIYGLKMITDIGGQFAIITATFPPILYDIMKSLEIPYEKQEEDFNPHIEVRHKIELIKNQDFDYEKIETQGKTNKVLIIVNTVKRAQKVFEKLNGEANLLHSHYIKNDRDKLEKEILRFADEKGENGIWISTQIVEASLDIDFDYLYTEMCSIDSLLQRMGRVYRKRKLEKLEPNVFILDNRNGVPYIIDTDIYDYSIEEIIKYNNKELNEKEKKNMIYNIFGMEKMKNSRYLKKIKKELNELENIIPNEMTKEFINDKFRNIQNINLIPDNIYQKLYNLGKIKEWKKIFITNDGNVKEKINAKNEIRKYVISVRKSPLVIKDEKELFYKYSNIYLTQYNYEFDEDRLKGKGLIMNNLIGIKKSGYFDE